MDEGPKRDATLSVGRTGGKTVRGQRTGKTQADTYPRLGFVRPARSRTKTATSLEVARASWDIIMTGRAGSSDDHVCRSAPGLGPASAEHRPPLCRGLVKIAVSTAASVADLWPRQRIQ
jgi:hypothetical protein